MGWRDQVAAMDAAVDAQWAERARLLPWHASDYDDGEADTSRPVVDLSGVLRLDNDTVTTGGATRSRAERIGEAFPVKMALQPCRLSIAAAEWAGADIRQDDRVHMLDPERAGTENEFFVIVWLGADASGRQELHLARRRVS